MMDLPSGEIISFVVIDTDYLEVHHATELFAKSHAKVNRWPKKIILAKSDPGESTLQQVAATHGVSIQCVPAPQIEDLVAPVKQSYGQRIFSPSSISYASIDDDTDEMDMESVRQMVPDAYDPCWCGSDKKFKFCCKPIFREIVGAMGSAEDRNLSAALRYIGEAKRIAGETAEVLCREAIVWASFDKEKSDAVLNRALAVNPRHPRANYILGINLKEADNLPGAIEAYKRAIENYPKTDRFHLSEAYNNLGTAHFLSGDHMAAKAAWEQALVLLPSDKTVRQNLLEFIYENPELSAAERSVSPLMKKHLERRR